MPPSVSAVLNHPSTGCVTDAGAAVNVGGGIVIMGPVLVYVGSRSTATSAFVIAGGGQGNCVDEAESIVEGVPPVCHGWKGPSNGVSARPSDAHIPKAVRGSLGIQPFSNPSEYDQSGVSTRPASEGAIYIGFYEQDQQCAEILFAYLPRPEEPITKSVKGGRHIVLNTGLHRRIPRLPGIVFWTLRIGGCDIYTTHVQTAVVRRGRHLTSHSDTKSATPNIESFN